MYFRNQIDKNSQQKVRISQNTTRKIQKVTVPIKKLQQTEKFKY